MIGISSKRKVLRPLILMSRSYKIKNFEYIQKTISKQFIVLDIVNWDKHKKNCLFPIMFILSTIWIFRINHKAHFFKRKEKTSLKILFKLWCRKLGYIDDICATSPWIMQIWVNLEGVVNSASTPSINKLLILILILIIFVLYHHFYEFKGLSLVRLINN